MKGATEATVKPAPQAEAPTLHSRMLVSAALHWWDRNPTPHSATYEWPPTNSPSVAERNL
jgi:hypothetical protein